MKTLLLLTRIRDLTDLETGQKVKTRGFLGGPIIKEKKNVPD